ncbi:unnamed protein product [Caenorhabditis brenneri]
MNPYLTDRSTAYKKYTAFLFNSLKTKTQPIPKRILSEMFKEGKNVKHFTRMENNFNAHVVPLIIGYNSTWEEKAHMFFVSATPVLGTDLKAKFEMAGALELDENCRISKFYSVNFTLQRNQSHTAYHKPMSDKAKRENTKVQDEAFEKFMGQINENNVALDFNNDEMNKSTSHLRQEVLKFLMMFLNFLGQRFPGVKATIAQVAEKVIQFDDYYDENLELSAVSVQLCVMNFVDSLTSGNTTSDHGPEIKNVLEMFKNLLKNERNLHLVHDSLEEFLQEKFNSMDHNKKTSAENFCQALDVMIKELKGRRTNDQANVDHADMDPVEFARPLVDNVDPMEVALQEEEDREALVPVEDAGQPVDNENANPVQVGNTAANPMNDANDDPMGVDREIEEQDALNAVEVARPLVNNENADPMENANAAADRLGVEGANHDPIGVDRLGEHREALDPVEDAAQPIDNDDVDPIQVDNAAANPMNDANDDPMGVDREIEEQDALNAVEVARPQINNENVDIIGVGNAAADPMNDANDDLMEVDRQVENDAFNPVEVARPQVNNENGGPIENVNAAADRLGVENANVDPIRVDREVEEQNAPNPVEHVRPPMDDGNDAHIPVGEEAANRMNVNDGSIEVEPLGENREALVPVENARPPMDNGNYVYMPVGEEAADPINGDNDDLMEVDRLGEEDREALVPVEDARQPVDNGNDANMPVGEKEANLMNANDGNDSHMGVEPLGENQEPLNPVEHARQAMNIGNDVLMEVGDEAVDPVYADDNNDGHIGVDHQVEGQEALVPVEDADPPMDNGDDGRMLVGEEEADLINEYRAFFDALGYYHPEDDREALVPVEDARQPVDNENDDYMGVPNVAVNRMDGFLANDDPMRINRQVNPMEIDPPAVNHGRADHPLVENAEANRMVTGAGKAVFSDVRTREFCLESFKFLEKFVETFKSYQGCKTMKRLDEVLEYVTSHQSDPRRYETGTLSMSFFYSKVKETFQRLFHQNLANNARYDIFERKFQRGFLCSDLVSHFCDSLDRSPTMKVFSVPVRKECSKMLTDRNTIIPYKRIVDELWRFHQKIKFSLVKRAN